MGLFFEYFPFLGESYLQHKPTKPDYLFTQAGIFLALTCPGFFLSTRRGSRVTHPAVKRTVSDLLPNKYLQ